eukprot:4396490-Pyramimonas_sp.AAC.1
MCLNLARVTRRAPHWGLGFGFGSCRVRRACGRGEAARAPALPRPASCQKESRSGPAGCARGYPA